MPRDFREEMTNAYAVVKEGINENVKNVGNAGSNADDLTTRIGAVVRELPSVVLSPIIILPSAASNILVGARNELIPDARREDQDKYKTHVADR